MQTLTLIHSDRFPIALYADALMRESIAPRKVTGLEGVTADPSVLRVLLVDRNIGGNGSSFRLDGHTAVVEFGLNVM